MRVIRSFQAAPLVLAVAAPAALALPDIAPELYGVTIEHGATVGSGDVTEGCAAATTGRTLIRFGVRFRNSGDEPLVIGDPGCPDCLTSPGATCEDPNYICSPADGHNHPHFVDFANYELLDAAGRLLALGGKRSFCIADFACDPGLTPQTTCTDQGLTPGCWDDYRASLGCQYIDATDVPDVDTRAMTVRVTLDPDSLLPDGDRSNNVNEVLIPGCGDGEVQDGEECDAGAGTNGSCCNESCCDASCHLVTGPPGCRIDGMCVPPGTADSTGCLVCDLQRRADGWSPYDAPDPRGIGCRLTGIATDSGRSCDAKTGMRVGLRVLRLQRLVGRIEAQPRPKLGRQLARRARELERMAHRRGCVEDEATALAQQAAAFAREIAQ